MARDVPTLSKGSSSTSPLTAKASGGTGAANIGSTVGGGSQTLQGQVGADTFRVTWVGHEFVWNGSARFWRPVGLKRFKKGSIGGLESALPSKVM